MTNKESNYNILLTEGHGALLANLVTAALVQLDDEHVKLVRRILKEPNKPYFGEEKNTLEILKNNGFLIDSDFDELAYLKLRFYVARYGNEALGLSILPTLRCNFRCVYCYEDHLNIDMEEGVRKNLLRFVDRELPGKREFDISWFGGEPLLRLDLIEDLSSDFLRLCDRYTVEYKAEITTNGYLLTPSTAKTLAELGVYAAQVTLDGPPEAHDSRRVLANGKGTFSQIMDNILENADLLKFKIRVNIDHGTAPLAGQLLDFLEPVKEKIILGFYPVSPTSRATDSGIKCLSMSSFADVHREILKEAHERGFRLVKGFALTATVYCGAYQFNTHIVDPRGDVFKCVEDVGHPEHRAGYLTDQGTIQFDYPRMLPWAVWDPFQDPECRKCEVLPVCMGGCLRLLGRPSKERCFLKQTIKERIRFAFEGVAKAQRKGGEKQ
ncbi:MAG: radical SAM protein [Candidatus Bipolaricaulota bacterium]|nr:radical SAM protein [Candidatus Bipolaricaulota bacterium]